MRPRMVLPIRLYSSSSITLNERFRRLEYSHSRRGGPTPLGIRHTNSQRTPAALRLGQKFTGFPRGRGRPSKNSGRPSNQKPSISTAQPLPYTSSARGNGFRGRGRFTPGRGAARALQKRRRRTRRFNHGGGVAANNTDPEKVRADLDKELNEYMEGTDGK